MAQFGYPTSDASNAWASGGFGDMDEGATFDDGDFAYSADNPGGAVLEVHLGDVTDPGLGTGHVVRYRWATVDGGVLDGGGTSVTQVYALIQGTTLIATLNTHTTNSATFSAASATLSGAEADAITDYTDLRLRITASGGGGSPTNRRGAACSWAEFEAPNVSNDRAAVVTAFELEAENAPRQAIVTAFELESEDPPAPVSSLNITRKPVGRGIGHYPYTDQFRAQHIYWDFRYDEGQGSPFDHGPGHAGLGVYGETGDTNDANWRESHLGLVRTYRGSQSGTTAGESTYDSYGTQKFPALRQTFEIYFRFFDKRTPAGNDQHRMFGHHGDYEFVVEHNGSDYEVSPDFIVKKTGANPTITKDLWHHVIATAVGDGAANTGERVVWIDGVKVFSETGQALQAVQAGEMRIGHRAGGDDWDGFWGDMLFLRVYTEAATDAQVEAMFRYPFPVEQTRRVIGDTDRQAIVTAYELQVGEPPRQAIVTAFEMEAEPAGRQAVVTAYEFEAENAPRQAIVTAYELEGEPAPRQAIVTAYELESTEAGRQAIVTAYELEAEPAGRQAIVTAFEMEAEPAGRQAIVTAYELETEPAARQAAVTAYELEGEPAPRQAIVTAYELETEPAGRQAIVTAYELEGEEPPRQAIVTAFEFETEQASRQAIVTAYELEGETAGRQAIVTAYEFEAENAPRQAIVTAFEMEAEEGPRQAIVTAYEMEAEEPPRQAIVTAYELEAEPAGRQAIVTAYELETEPAGRQAIVTAYELEAENAPRQAIVTAYEFETEDAVADRQAVVTAFELEAEEPPRQAIVTAYELEGESPARAVIVTAFELEGEAAPLRVAIHERIAIPIGIGI